MRKLIILKIFILVLLFEINIYSQQWTKFLPSNDKIELSLFDYQKAFNKYWSQYNVINGYYFDENGNRKKAAGWKQFKRWEYYWEQRVDKETGKFPEIKSSDLIRKIYNPAQKMIISTSSSNWSSLGPNSSGGGYAGVGRINCIAFHPTNNNTFWIGAAAGGIWKTTDGGASWTVLNNGTAVLGVSDILIPSDYSSSNTIYIATGDKDAWDNYSVGVLKSTDGGSTWNSTALSYPVANGKMVNKLIIDPNNNQIILAATKDGIYKTIDGGTNWNTQLSSERFVDLEYKPGNFSTLIAGTRYGGEIWRSTNGGANWTLVKNTVGERVEIAVSQSTPSRIYAIVANSDDGLEGVYKSTDSGASFSKVFDGTASGNNLLGWDNGGDSGGQGWYDLSLEVNPDDADMLFLGGVNTWKSTDAGSSFNLANHWSGGYSAPEVHADKHRLRYRLNGDLFECNDGGVYISTNDGSSWSDKTNGMTISQMYKIGVAQTANNDIITGLQDNGTKNYSSGTWSDVIGGDGMDCAIDYTDADIQYGELYYGDLKKTTNHWASKSNIQPSGSSGAWVTPFVLDPNDHNTIIAGYQNIYKSTNQGGSWSNIYNLDSSDKFRSLDIAPSNSQVIYAGEKYVLWKTTDGGNNWTEITSGLPSNKYITDITIKNNDENTVWITLSTYDGNSVWETTDAGSNWSDISAGLPAVPAHNIVQNRLKTSETELYIATDNGVYIKSGTGNWATFNNGLPNVEVRELEIYYDNNDNSNSLIRAGTFGRGLWETTFYVPEPPDPDQSKDIVFSDITTNKMTVNWTNGTGTNRIVKINTSDSFSSPVNGTDPPANTVYGGGEQVVFNGSAGPVTITSLTASTTYYFRVYDYNGSGTTTVYNTSTGINNPESQQTYCQPSSANNDDDYIKRFILNSIDNTSGETDYTDFTNISTALLPDTTYDVSVEVSGYNEYLSLWIDMNDNQQFESSEKLINEFVCSANSLSTTQLTLPASSNYGSHIMRARVSYYQDFDACEEVSYGEGEDYIVDFKDKFTWTGDNSSDWFDKDNWDVGKIPTINYEVIIPNTTNKPEIGAGLIGNAKKIITNTGATITIYGELNIVE